MSKELQRIQKAGPVDRGSPQTMACPPTEVIDTFPKSGGNRRVADHSLTLQRTPVGERL